MVAPFDAVDSSGAHVLADEGRDGDAEGSDDHPEDGVDLAVGGIGGINRLVGKQSK